MEGAWRWYIGAGLLGVLAVPLVAAAVAAGSPRWYPLYDLAMTEMRVRDVGLAHPPLVGLPGRLEGHGQQGSHPGPLGFYALAPTYRLLGSTAWAMEVGVVVLNVVALGAALVAAVRRGGPAVALGVAVALAVTMRALGPEVVSHAWNPFLPALWWVAFLLAVWSVLDGDPPFLPVVVFAGSFCAQTHVSYVVLVAVLAGLAFAWTAGQERSDRSGWWWLAGSLAFGALLWAPPVVDQLGDGTGNLSVIVESFREPATPAIGVGDGLDIWFSRLDPWSLATGDAVTGAGATVRALVLLAAWVASVALAWRHPVQGVLWLDLVLAVALGVGLVSLTRISGVPWFYLHLWGWGTTALVLVATVWSAVVARAAARPVPTTLTRWGPVALGAALVVVAGAFTWDTAHREEPVPELTAGVRGVAPAALEALDRDDAPGGGPDGHYLVEWVDPVAIGDQGWSLLSELERVGLDANVDPAFAVGARDHRVIRPDRATATVTLVIGPTIEEFRDRPGAVELSYFDPRTEAEQERFADLRDQVEDGLRDAGADPGLLDVSLLVAGQQPGLSPATQAALVEMQELGLPLAVFVEES